MVSMKVVYGKFHVVNRTVNTLRWTRKFTGSVTGELGHVGVIKSTLKPATGRA